MERNEKLLSSIDEYVKLHVKQSRYEHTLRTARKCVELCKKYGVDQNAGFLAGLSHDMCKDFSDEAMLELVKVDGREVSEIEKNKPALLHGRCAAIMLAKDFEVLESDVLEAVEYHTFGKVGMSNLAKILYIADKIEPGRPHVSEEYYKKLENFSLNQLMVFVTQENVDYLENKGLKVAPGTYDLLESLKKEV